MIRCVKYWLVIMISNEETESFRRIVTYDAARWKDSVRLPRRRVNPPLEMKKWREYCWFRHHALPSDKPLSFARLVPEVEVLCPFDLRVLPTRRRGHAVEVEGNWIPVARAHGPVLHAVAVQLEALRRQRAYPREGPAEIRDLCFSNSESERIFFEL